MIESGYLMPSKNQLAQVVSTKGQVVIPVELREELGIEPGTQICFEKCKDGLLLRPVTKAFIRSLRGYFGEGPSLGDVRDEEHRKERL